ncbi:MAG: DUF2569 family protein [Candidatus Gracilibacteria bacterium]|nr:DUF2569 family protein [Candidatus Gracilibacteria bacterium]MDD3120234.1 DUF2569 family protein [Candidatus Gracilibacteria bacterium]
MNCKHCNNELSVDAKFCNKCGKPIKIEKKEKIEIKGIRGRLSFFLFGLFVSTIINLIVGISAISGMIETTGLPKSWIYSLAFLDVLYFGGLIAFTIYTILAFLKLKENAVSLGKMYLILIFFSNLISVIFSAFTGEPIATETSYLDSSQIVVRSLVYSVIWFLYLIISKRVNNTFPKENRKTKTFDKLFFSAIIAIPIVIYSLGFIGSSIQQESTGQQSTEMNSTLSTENLIKETVKAIKIEMVLPNQLDETTQLVDITAQPSAIRYHYIFTNVDTKSLSNSYLKESLSPNVCQDSDAKKLLNQGIDMEYSYIVEDATEKYFISFNKADCQPQTAVQPKAPEQICNKEENCCTINEDCKYIWYTGGCNTSEYVAKMQKEAQEKGALIGEAPRRENVTCTCENNKCVTHY